MKQSDFPTRYSFAQMFSGLNQGGKWRRNSWKKTTYIKLGDDGLCYIHFEHGPHHRRNRFEWTPPLIEHDHWEYVGRSDPERLCEGQTAEYWRDLYLKLSVMSLSPPAAQDEYCGKTAKEWYRVSVSANTELSRLRRKVRELLDV